MTGWKVYIQLTWSSAYRMNPLRWIKCPTTISNRGQGGRATAHPTQAWANGHHLTQASCWRVPGHHCHRSITWMPLAREVCLSQGRQSCFLGSGQTWARPVRVTLPIQCFLLVSDLQIPKNCQVEVWTCILRLVTTDGILLALVSTVKTAFKDPGTKKWKSTNLEKN